ncbi:hypothetical protein [Sanguibacter massiliensis]|uniref:hypothetical protein n=1 Tax=Sanguibacter massiliensis TaxID=1973217 RepID=UPI00101ADF60|nr:hypothetical protein [Sanguibacter massiliensis]
MSDVGRILGRAVLGAALAVSVLFIVSVAVVGVSAMIGKGVDVPLVINVNVAEENGLPAVYFEPYLSGMALLAGVIIGVTVGAWFASGKRRAPAKTDSTDA